MPADAATGRNAALYDGKVKEKVFRFVVSQRPLPSYLLRRSFSHSLSISETLKMEMALGGEEKSWQSSQQTNEENPTTKQILN